jgi:hypothetical protein
MSNCLFGYLKLATGRLCVWLLSAASLACKRKCSVAGKPAECQSVWLSSDVMTHKGMSVYEARRWDDLEKHWAKKASRRELMPTKLRAAGEKTKAVAVRTGVAVAEATPESIREFGVKAADAALMPAVEGIVHLIELANDWAVELTDPEKVLEFHRGRAGM